ncbi:MAG: TonB-dependent receptor [Byssovorax sp.]
MNITQRRLLAGLSAPIVLLVSAAAQAQGTSVLTGTVRDAATKAPVPDAVVTVTSPSLQGEQLVVTDASGQYRVPNLPPGVYTLRLDKDTYRPYARGGIDLRLNSTIRVNTDLLPEAIKADVVEIIAAAPTVDVGSSTTGVNVGSDFVNRIALSAPSGKGAAQRSFESLAEIAPGAVADQYGISIAGTTSPENQYVIDGLSVNNPAFGLLGTSLPVEFVKDFNVITGGYMPEYGRSAGGYLDVATKTGSNEFHGSVFFNITPGGLDGSRKTVLREGSTISTTTSLSSLQSFGAEVGGPLFKDRLWFYVGVSPAFARYRLERGLNSIRLGADGQPVKDENGFTQTDPIPGTGATYYATLRSFSYLAKLTWLINRDSTLNVSIYGTPTYSGGDGTYGINPRDGSVEINNSNNNNILNGDYKALAHNYVSSPTDVVLKYSTAFNNKRQLFDATFGWHHQEELVNGADGSQLGSGKGYSNISQVLWQRTDPGPHSITDFEASSTVKAACEPAGSTSTLCPVTTYYSGGPGAIPRAILDRWQGKAVGTGLFTYLGHHVVKAGFDMEVAQYNSSRGYSGSNIYYETPDGTAFQDYRRFGFLVGPDKAVALQKFDAVSRSTTLGGFAQDSWSVLDRVTVNVGVRYDAQLLFGYDGRMAMALTNEWSPRLGAIYDFTREGRSKLYANFARFYESVPLDAIDRSIPGERQIYSYHDAGACDPRSVAQQHNQCESDASRPVVNGVYAPNQRWGIVGSDKSPVDPDIQAQSADELVLGGEYEVFPSARVGVSYTKRWQNRVIEDMSRDEAQTYFIGNPGYGIAKDFPKATRDYDGVTFFFQKTFANTWLAQASYTVSSLRGNWAGLFRPETGQIDPNINSDFDLSTLLPNRTGPLPGDHTHQIKLYGAKDFILPAKALITLGGTYRGYSGGPTSFLGSHAIYGPDQAFILPRGSGERLPWVHNIDAHLGVGMQLTKDSAVQISMDVFNLFNFQAETARDQRYTLDNVLPIGDGTANSNDLKNLKNSDGSAFDPTHKNPNFGNPVAYQAPRSFRFGARVTF